MSNSTPVRWDVHRASGTAADHHRRVPRASDRRELWLCRLDAPALVLGSHQPDDLVDRDVAERRGVEVVRRRTGGGAVLLVPGEALWIDVVVPRDDPLWTDDVRRSFAWVGRWWHGALASLGVDTTIVTRYEPGRWGDLVCFAGRGPGEVVSERGGAKLVGLSQRRTATASHIQCLALARWAPADLLDLLILDPDARVRAVAELGSVAAGLPVPLDAVEAPLLAQLP